MFCGGESRGGKCLPFPILVTDLVLAVVHGVIFLVSFFQILRIHLRNQQHGWTRQKIIHSMIGSSSLGFMIYFICIPIAACQGWLCWLCGCGFILMAFPQILFLAAFLLLLSFWVDQCHQANDEEEEEDDENFYNEDVQGNQSLLEKTEAESGNSNQIINGHRRCSFPMIHVGRRQKIVIMVVLLIFLFMVAFAVLIWIGKGKNPINSSLMAMLYMDTFSTVILLLGIALACYGGLLFSKMSKVRSEMVSAEMWKVASLSVVSLVCFTASTLLALVTNVPLQVMETWKLEDGNSINTSVLLFLYYLFGSSVPSSYVLWVMREMPPRHAREKIEQVRIVTFVRDESPSTERRWTATTTSTNQASRASPI